MSEDERDRWNERYASDEREPPREPAAVLIEHLDDLPRGRALDVATGAGRNAICLAENGFDFDAVDVSERGLTIARDRASGAGVDVSFVHADVDEFVPERGAYDVVVVVNFHALDRPPALKAALKPGGFLLYEHFSTLSGGDSGPPVRYRFGPNELLRASRSADRPLRGTDRRVRRPRHARRAKIARGGRLGRPSNVRNR